MDLDRIFTLIVIIIIWVLSNAIRKISKPEQKDQAPTTQAPGLFRILQQKMVALEEEGRAEEIIELDEYFQPPAKQPRQKLESLIDIAERALPQDPATTAKKMLPTQPPEAKTDTTSPSAILKNPTMTNQRKLQNAIIWSEILAPPVALRDQ